MRPRALITGGSAGLGRAMVEHLLALGFDVVSVDREAAMGDGGSVEIICDLGERGEVGRNIETIVAGGPYEIVCLNAGTSATGRFETIPLEAYRRLLTVNTETPLLIASALMRANAITGHLCFVSSLSHFTGYPGAAVYAASKDALAIYAKSVRSPFGRKGVKVTVAFPGPLRTDHAARHAPPGASEARRTRPEVAARAILEATLAGRAWAFSDRRARAIALAGRLMPGWMARVMRKTIFDRLEREVW